MKTFCNVVQWLAGRNVSKMIFMYFCVEWFIKCRSVTSRDVVYETMVLASRPEFWALGLGFVTCGLRHGLEGLVWAVFKTRR